METPPEWKTCMRAVGRSQPGAFMKVAVKHTWACFAVFVRITHRLPLFSILGKLYFLFFTPSYPTFTQTY